MPTYREDNLALGHHMQVCKTRYFFSNSFLAGGCDQPILFELVYKV